MSKKWMAMGVLAAVLSVSSLSLAATINYAENFSGWAWDTLLPTSSGTATASSGYYYCGSATDSVFGGVTWGPAMDWKLIYMNNAPSYDGNIYRSFRSSGELAADEYFTTSVVSGWIQHDQGLDEDPNLWSRIGVLGDSSSGYVGAISRNGQMIIYKVTGGTYAQVASLDASLVPDGNGKVMSLSVNSGVVTLSFTYPSDSSTTYSVSANDTTYKYFTTIMYGGNYGYYEHMSIDNTALTGTVVPEPATLSLLSLAGLAVIRRAKK